CKRPKPPDEATLKEMKKLAGTWAVAAMVQDGFTIPERNISKLKYIIREGKLIIRTARDPSSPGAQPFTEATRTYELNVTARPRTIDMRGWRDGIPGASYYGIYQLEGDELTICLSSSISETRPTAFESKPRSMETLIKLKRENP